MKVAKFLRTGIFSMIFAIFLSAAICTADVTINVPETFQEHSNWCWAGSSKAVLDYYSNVQSQCTIANYAWSRTDCCGNSDFNWSHTCNSANSMYGASGSLQDILTHWGVSSNALSTTLTQTAFVAEINNCRPFVMRFGWTGGGGHFLVGRGYDQSGAYMDYMDPWTGNGYTKSLYSWVVSASDHNWTHTLQVTTAHSCGSCPQLWYLGDDGNYIQFGTMLGGAVGREQEFRAYIPLRDLGRVKKGGEYTFQIREDDPEHSFIDLVKLAVIDYSDEFDLLGYFLNYPHIIPNFVKNPTTYLPWLRMAMTVSPPLTAEHSTLGGVNYLLSRPDDQYVPLEKGEYITLSFEAPQLVDDMREVLFVIEGYYIRD